MFVTYFIRSVLTNMFRPLLQSSSDYYYYYYYYYYYKNTNVQMCLAVSLSRHNN